MRSVKDNLKFMEEMARMATGGMSSVTQIRDQVKKLVKERLDDVMGGLDMVSRTEFERVETIAVKARARQEELEKRIKDLEKSLKGAKTAKAALKKAKK